MIKEDFVYFLKGIVNLIVLVVFSPVVLLIIWVDAIVFIGGKKGGKKERGLFENVSKYYPPFK